MQENINNTKITDKLIYKISAQAEKIKISVYKDSVLERETEWNVNLANGKEPIILPSNINQDVLVAEYDANGVCLISTFYPAITRRLLTKNNGR